MQDDGGPTDEDRKKARQWLYGPLNGNPDAISACEESLASLLAAERNFTLSNKAAKQNNRK